ncbi:MAG: hypothetical protein HY860_03305 [Chlamydiales bacterium]|nr:hypothetical protein [Chlamydiales bacterium]
MKRLLIIIFCFSFLIIGYTASYITKPTEVTSVADCSALSDDEQAFADELSAMQRELFCRMFNDDQRAKAMSSAKKSKNANAEDDAVEQVLKESRQSPEISAKS